MERSKIFSYSENCINKFSATLLNKPVSFECNDNYGMNLFV